MFIPEIPAQKEVRANNTLHSFRLGRSDKSFGTMYGLITNAPFDARIETCPSGS